MQIANYINEQEAGRGDGASTDPERAASSTLTAADPATMDAIEKEVLATFTDFIKVSARRARRWCSRSDEGQVDALPARSPWTRRCSSSAAASTSGAWPRWTCASWAPTPSRSPCRAAGSRAGQGAGGHHRAARVPHGGRHHRLLPSRPTRRRRPPEGSNITLDTGEGFPQLVGAGPRGAAGLREGQGARRTARCCWSAWPARRRRATCDSYRTYLVEKEVPLTGESLTRRGCQRQPAQRARGEHHASTRPGARELRAAHREGRGPAHGHRAGRQRAVRAAHQRADRRRPGAHHHGPRGRHVPSRSGWPRRRRWRWSSRRARCRRR